MFYLSHRDSLLMYAAEAPGDVAAKLSTEGRHIVGNEEIGMNKASHNARGRDVPGCRRGSNGVSRQLDLWPLDKPRPT